MEQALIARRSILALPIALAVTSPALAASTRTARDLLRAFLDTLSAHDLEAFRALYVDDGYVQHQTLVTNTPSATNGPDAAVAYFRKRIEAFPDLKVTSDVSVVDGDMISANLIWSGTHTGEYLGVPATGRHVTFNSTDIMKVRDGLFSEHWGAADLYGLVSQLKA
ncbi:ester cyclase [Rhizobium sp.]|uniref:ester cyclase n=1 Tax=Rhizobium sp. TaxID=391 RepID=UPI002EE831BB